MRVLILVGVLVGALGVSGPALALLGITLPIPSAGNPTTAVTLHVEDSTDTDITPDKSLDLSGLNATGLTGITNLVGGLTQTGSTLTQLLNGLNKGASVALPFVQAHATEAAGTAIANFKTRAEATAAAALALDPAAAQSEVMGNITDLQGQALGEVAGVLPLALTTGLQVVQDVVSPVCSLTAIPSSFLPGVGIDLTRAYTSVAPGIQQTDMVTNKLITDTYAQVYDNTLASVNNIPNVGPIASALISLLKFNWNTTYTPPGGTPVVHSTKALIDVPTPIDVDGSGGFDLCGTLTFALEGSGTSITGIKFTQTITKMPLANPVLPVDITGGLLNVLNFGYDTTESTVPIVYTTSATVDLAGLKVNLDNTYSVHRGKNLVIPPLSLAALGTTGLPTFPPLLTDAPKPIVTQKVCIGACTALALKYRFENVPTTTHVDAPLLPLTGTKVNYQGAQTSDSFSYRLQAGATTAFGTSAGRDPVATEVGGARTFSAPTDLAWCYDFTSGTCSPTSVAGDKSSIGIKSSSPTFVENYLQTAAALPVACSSSSTYDSHIATEGAFTESHTPPTTTVGSGRLEVDTAGKPADGCVGMLAAAALGSQPPSLTMPAGFTADKRVATYHTTQLGTIILGVVPDSKTGTITCPTGTVASWTSISGAIGQPNLMPIICSLPPVNTAAPAITGQALVDATLTAGNGTWTPGAPNTPAFVKQWFKCDAAGAGCAPITGATGNTYELQYGSYPNEPTDFGHTFKVSVTGTNLDGTATSTSAPTAVVALPPPPVIATAPVLGANRKVDVATTTTNGTYTNGATTFGYKWQRCDAAGTPASCADVAGETSSSYTVRAADKGMTIRSAVTASNHGGTALVNYSATAFIPPNPVNHVLPGIKNGPANAVGASVATGDNLSASSGTWDFTTDPFTYQWQRCDGGGNSCVDISGATSATYQLAHPADDGSTVRVVVTGHGLNGETPAPSGATGVILFNDLSAKTVTQIPDGTVSATTAGSGSTTYVGGSFDTVGAPTGGSGLVSDGGTGSSVTLASATAGAANGGVNATVPDGSGGYFLGGSFTQVKGVQCPSLAHISSDGTVDQNYCYGGLSGTVRALTRATGGTSKVLAVGGDFSYGGHNNLMFIDPANSANPVYLAGGDPNGVVKAMSVNATSTIYFGGQFSKAGGTDAGLLGSGTLTWTSGQLTSVPRTNWSAGVCIGVPTGTSACTDNAATVNTVAWLSSGFVAVGGRFDRNFRVVNGANPTNSATRSNALLVGESGAAPTLLGWAPVIAGGAQTVNAIAPGIGGSINNIPIYIGGDFATVNGVAVKNLAEVGCNFIGGNSSSGTANNSGPMNTWLPNPNGVVTSLAWAGTNQASTLIVGGAFTTIDSRPNTATAMTTLVRHRLAKINIGVYTSTTLPVVDGTWDPNAGRTVRAVSRDTTSGTVTIGGDFLVLGGKTRNNLAEFDPNSGVTNWNPGSDGAVTALAFRSGTVYAGGTFANAGGAPRANLAALDGSTGNATSWNPGANGAVNALATDASNVYVGGAFSTAGGQPRASLAAIDGSGAPTGWNPGTDGTVKALAVNGSTVYVGGSFANAGGAARSNAAAIDSTGSVTGFAPNADGAVNAVAASNAGVYLGGAFTHVGPDARDRVAFVDPSTGAAAAWNPGVNGTVNAVFLVGSQVFVGGDFTAAGGATRANLAALDAGSDAALSFKPDPNGTVRALSRTSGGSIAVGGSFTIIAGQAAPALGFFGG